jgi:hypothetical protein
METDDNCVEVWGIKSVVDGDEELWLNCGV